MWPNEESLSVSTTATTSDTGLEMYHMCSHVASRNIVLYGIVLIYLQSLCAYGRHIGNLSDHPHDHLITAISVN